MLRRLGDSGRSEGMRSTASLEFGRTGQTLALDLLLRRQSGALALHDRRPRTDYRVSAWMKTEKVESTSVRIQVNGLTEPVAMPSMTGTTDWRQLETNFNSGTETQLSVNTVLGGEALASLVR